MTRFHLKMDERNVKIIHELQAVAHSLTIILMIVFFIRRLHILGQPFENNWDLGILIMLNGAFLLGGILYRGGISWPRLKVSWVLAAYLGFTLAVILFKFIIEFIVKGHPFSLSSMMSRELLVVVAVCACITTVFTAIAYLGQLARKRELE